MTDLTSGSTPRLVVRRGPNPDNVYILRRLITIVGREPLNDVVIPDPEVSRRHARIFLEESSFLIEDLNSTNGTYVNGRRITAKTRLTSGDIIDFGETIRVIYEHDIAPTGASDTADSAFPVSEAESILAGMTPFPGDRATAKPMRPTVRHKITETDQHERSAEGAGRTDETTALSEEKGTGFQDLSSGWFVAFGLGFILIIVISAIILFIFLNATTPGLF